MVIRHAKHGNLRNYILAFKEFCLIFAPEILRCKPYTTQSEVYSLELTSDEPPFSTNHHDVGLALVVLDH
ncbi:kinase-like domain-containing protein [Rhizophagus irregularis DAOM 181602=DAOM 197198]|nr:kinase-like domain-containing protein [Rhizophagus irregularis DAOM 181602=DAOM 197198]